MSAATVLRFVTPPPGLEPLVDFRLDPVTGASGLFTLQAVDRPEVRIFTIDAAAHLPGYSPELPDDRAREIGVASAEEVLALVVVTPSPEGSTVNLLAPVLVNRATGASLQLVLDDDSFPVRAELAALANA
ncbi:flagellar assembly protein FliW [Leifsonia poae]|uniref:flagellar assembly protein FliW n=1 Tax=Leifsonia poae TaxID=110933 RepID=UPI001CBFFAF8|nr:flagellar assembly protein FliW [Leifsonia poae]